MGEYDEEEYDNEDYDEEEIQDDEFPVGDDVNDINEDLELEEEDDGNDVNEKVILSDMSNKIKITSKYLNKYERTRILGTRALQISLGSPPMVDIKDVIDPYEIAILELESKVLPINIRRYLPNNTYEDWKMSELEFI